MVARHPPYPTLWWLPDTHPFPPFGEGYSNCRQSVGVWVGRLGPSRSLGSWGVWNPLTYIRSRDRLSKSPAYVLKY